MALSPKEFFFRKKRMENKTLCLLTFSSPSRNQGGGELTRWQKF
jgi:hypothetical protein